MNLPIQPSLENEAGLFVCLEKGLGKGKRGGKIKGKRRAKTG